MGIFKKIEEGDAAIEEFEELEDIDDGDENVEESKPGVFEANGKKYMIRYTQKRVELYEQGHKPIMAAFVQNGGAFSVDELKWLLAYGLCLEGGPFVSPKRGAEMANNLMNANGYIEIFAAVTDALQRDCGFLFKEPKITPESE